MSESEERYIDMHQKCLDERREKEEQIASMQEYMDGEIAHYRDEADLQKERVRVAQYENERIIASMNQREGVNDEVARQMDGV